MRFPRYMKRRGLRSLTLYSGDRPQLPDFTSRRWGRTLSATKTHTRYIYMKSATPFRTVLFRRSRSIPEDVYYIILYNICIQAAYNIIDIYSPLNIGSSSGDEISLTPRHSSDRDP